MTTDQPIADRLADTIPEACARLRCSRSTLYLELKAGRLSAVKVRGRTLLLREEQARWLASLPKAYAPQDAA
jgi:excisionase family DNA binding protein